MPQSWETNPSTGGPTRSATNDSWEIAATLITEALSVRRAAAEMAKGKMTLVPAPMNAKPISEAAGAGEKNTSASPTARTHSRMRATAAGECFSTNASAKKRVAAWENAKQATAMPATRD